MKTTSRLKLVASAASVVRAATRPGAPSLSERARSVPRLVRAAVDGRYPGTTKRRLALVAAAVAYVASPIDLLPEAILPVLGAADDAVVISWAIKALIEETDRFLAWELGQRVVHPGSRVAGPSRRSAATRAALGSSASETGAGAAAGARDRRPGSGAGAGSRSRIGHQVRGAATSYVLESVRRRIER